MERCSFGDKSGIWVWSPALHSCRIYLSFLGSHTSFLVSFLQGSISGFMASVPRLCGRISRAMFFWGLCFSSYLHPSLSQMWHNTRCMPPLRFLCGGRDMEPCGICVRL